MILGRTSPSALSFSFSALSCWALSYFLGPQEGDPEYTLLLKQLGITGRLRQSAPSGLRETEKGPERQRRQTGLGKQGPLLTCSSPSLDGDPL
jgi:hypothetical protein